MGNSFAGLDLNGVDDLSEDYGRWLLHGPQGAGKTTLAASVAEMGQTLFIDLVGERGTRSLKGLPFAKNITIVRPTSITALDDVYWELAKGGHPFKAVVIDSATAVQKMTMRFLLGHDETAVREIKQGTAPSDQRTWGQALDVMTDLATFWYGLADAQRDHPMHVVMTAQTKLIENDEGDTVRTPDVQKGALSIMLASPDYIAYCDVEENLEALSDDTLPAVHHVLRFGAHPGYRTKARLPHHLRGKMSSVTLGRKRPTSLADLSRVLGIGGAPAAKKTAAKKAAPSPTTKEQ